MDWTHILVWDLLRHFFLYPSPWSFRYLNLCCVVNRRFRDLICEANFFTSGRTWEDIWGWNGEASGKECETEERWYERATLAEANNFIQGHFCGCGKPWNCCEQTVYFGDKGGIPSLYPCLYQQSWKWCFKQSIMLSSPVVGKKMAEAADSLTVSLSLFGNDVRRSAEN